MCQGPMHEFLRALPKCEHHMHLEGSLEPDLLFELAERNGVALPKDKDPAFESVEALLARYRRFTSLDDFLHYYFIGMSVLQSEGDFEALAYAYFKKAHADGVKHAEVFFDPQAHTERGVSYQTVVNGITAARKRALSEFGLSTELIVCMLRHFSLTNCEAMYRSALPDLEGGVIAGLGLSSTELGNPPVNYRDIYADAESRNIRRTAHAGEEAGVDYMASALHDLHVTRVDHGIKLLEDSKVMAEFVTRGVLITMCPISNVELRCVPSVADLPIPQYLEAGVKFSLNSDDPAYFGGYILDNYCAVQAAFGLSKDQWHTIAQNAIDGSWCPDTRKTQLHQMLAAAVAT